MGDRSPLSNSARIAIGSIITFISGFFFYLKANSDDIPRDLSQVYVLMKLKRMMLNLSKTGQNTLADVWEKAVAAYA